MKKLFYIVLVVILLMIVSYFVKEGHNKTQPTTTEETAVVDTVDAEQPAEVNGQAVVSCTCETECYCPEGIENCDECEAAREACKCQTEDGDIVEVEEEVEDVEEINPEETSDEGETIIKE